MKLKHGIKPTASLCLATTSLALLLAVKQDVANRSGCSSVPRPQAILSNCETGSWEPHQENSRFSATSLEVKQKFPKFHTLNLYQSKYLEKTPVISIPFISEIAEIFQRKPWRTPAIYLASFALKKPSYSAKKLNINAEKELTKNNQLNPKLIAANNRFSLKLFSQLVGRNQNQNIFISPTSISMTLAMTYNGAGGTTKSAIAQALELQGIDLPEVNQGNALLKTALQDANSQVQLSIVNSLWVDKNEKFKPEFSQNLNQFYQAELRSINFQDPSAKAIINEWVKQSTEGKIDSIIDRVEADTVFMLVNAVYFMGNWRSPFPKEATKPYQFTLPNGTSKQISMMFQQFYAAKYYQNELFQAIALPYKNDRLSMYIFLPERTVGLQRFYENLTPENWEKWIEQFRTLDYDSSPTVSLGLPRFKIDYQIDLVDTLKALGMQIAFDRSADFSAIGPPPLWISMFKHKTFVEVNEEGTQAGAVSAVGGTRGGSVQMIVDRPFFCAIHDSETGTILFMGSIVEPN